MEVNPLRKQSELSLFLRKVRQACIERQIDLRDLSELEFLDVAANAIKFKSWAEFSESVNRHLYKGVTPPLSIDYIKLIRDELLAQGCDEGHTPCGCTCNKEVVAPSGLKISDAIRTPKVKQAVFRYDVAECTDAYVEVSVRLHSSAEPEKIGCSPGYLIEEVHIVERLGVKLNAYRLKKEEQSLFEERFASYVEESVASFFASPIGVCD